MKRIAMICGGIAVVLAVSAFAYSQSDQREPVEFFVGHTHHDGMTVGAPEHSGGTDSNGCHNASVPYHCH